MTCDRTTNNDERAAAGPDSVNVACSTLPPVGLYMIIVNPDVGGSTKLVKTPPPCSLPAPEPWAKKCQPGNVACNKEVQ